MSNEEVITAKYGAKWYRIWVYFLASAVITSRFVFLASHSHSMTKMRLY